MKYSITFEEKDYSVLVDHLLGGDTERGAYVLCRPSISGSEVRLIVKKIIAVREEDTEESSSSHIKIPSRSFTRAIKKADDGKECFIFCHSHPAGVPDYSAQDYREEQELFRIAYNRIRTEGVHGSMVFSSRENPRARIWLQDGTTVSVSVIRVIGDRFRFYGIENSDILNTLFFDRQIRAFGPEIQKLLQHLTVGVVGLGGTGSAVVEELIRLGVGSLLVIDEQSFEKSNINRVYGSRVVDDGIPKVKITERLAADIGLGTKLKIINGSIVTEAVARELKDCDIVFGCTDDELGRSILTRLAIYYVVPVFDMAVKIDSEDGTIKSVEGRITTLIPGASCLFCRERISAANISAESIERNDPTEAAARRREGYIPELGEAAPAVIPFTTSIAAASILELLHRLTGCLGSDRKSSEVIYQFHESKIRTNNNPPKTDCWCVDEFYNKRADAAPFLDLTWEIIS